MGDSDQIGELEILSISGFDGRVLNGLQVHPDGVHFIYPFGNCVTIQNLKTRQQQFLRGHNNLVSAVAVSSNGKYIASGQINHIGFKALVIVWEFSSRSRVGSYELHQVRVESLAFSHEDLYLISLGGRDDARVLVFHLETMQPICGAAGNGANTGIATVIAPSRSRSSCFLTGGDKTLRLWRIDPLNRKLAHIEVNFNKIKRIITCLTVDGDDEIVYCGTSSGDIVQISLGENSGDEEDPIRAPVLIGVFGKHVERKTSQTPAECYSRGVSAIVLLKKGELVVGSGDGTVELVHQMDHVKGNQVNRRVKEPTQPSLKKIKRHDVESGVSTMKLVDGRLLIGTTESEIFSIGLDKWDLKMLTTCHTSAIYDVCFPNDMSAVFATCSKGSVRLWNTATGQELLRILVANMTCSGVVFQYNGRGIVTSWNDGKIRAFTPQTGQLKYVIEKAHNKGVSALACTRDDKVLVSGGGEGQVRVWDMSGTSQKLRAVLKEHKGPVSAIHINYANDEAASASTDGSCILWDILKCTRKNIIFAKTLFMAVCYHRNDFQVLTVGTDRKISYWETFDGSLIRDIEGATAAINTIHVSPCGDYFVTAGNDQIIKLWKYEESEVTHIGIGHAGIITQAKFSPDGRFIISVSSEGAIIRWNNPYFNTKKVGSADQEAHHIDTVRSQPDDQVKAKTTDKETVKDLQKVTRKSGGVSGQNPKISRESSKLSTSRSGKDVSKKNYAECVPCGNSPKMPEDTLGSNRGDVGRRDLNNSQDVSEEISSVEITPQTKPQVNMTPIRDDTKLN